MIHIGLIPGAKEPKLTVNSFLNPLVDELKELWSGVAFKCPNLPLKTVYIRAALTCCSSDIPATRKLCGFVGHGATHGCSKCNKEFLSLSNTGNRRNKKLDYSGFNTNSWPSRSLSQHQVQAHNHSVANDRKKQKDIEREFGIRYSILLELPYWNPIRYSTVDPMHNLFLGTAKHVMNVWLEKDCITKQQLKHIEHTVSKITTPRNVGRLPLKIASGFAGFTADQWRNWIIVFSPVALKNILDPDHLRCWLLFVRACFVLCNRIITSQAIEEMHCYLVQFCKHFEELYGVSACTPNMHLHLHLKDCIKDYGPAHSFWCYGFERFNGILGRYHTNHQSIEVQIMRKFLSEAQVKSLHPPVEAVDLFDISLDDKDMVGHPHKCTDIDIWKLQNLSSCPNSQSDYSIESEIISLLPPKFQGVLHAYEKDRINTVYNYLYPGINITYFSQFYQCAKKCIMADEIFSVSSVVTAFWPVESFTTELQYDLQVGQIQKFIKHTIKMMKNNTVVERTHVFCVLEWYIKHNNAGHYGSSAIVCRPITYAANSCQYMPIQRILHTCAHGKLDETFISSIEQIMVAIPIRLKYSF